MLQSFLDIGMLPIGEDDQKFNYLMSAAQDLANDLLQNRSKIIEYTLVSLDPEISPNSPALQQVQEAVKKHWSTYKNKFRGEMPRQILRAIIFESLQTIGKKDEDAAAIIFLTGSSFLPYTTLDREKPLCVSFLANMGNIAETKAVSEWSSNQEYQVPRMPVLKLERKDANTPQVNRESLTRELEAASGPQNEQGTPGQNPNPNWPNSHQPWAYKFAPRAADGITKVINQALVETIDYILENFGEFDKQLTKHAEAIKTKTKESLKQVLRDVEIQDRRNRLLWWQQTLYSPSTRQGYRSMDLPMRILSMAYDLHLQVTPHAPQSAEYLMREAVNAVSCQGEVESLEVGDFCKQLGTIQIERLPEEFGSGLFLSEANNTNRISLLTFIRLLLLGNATASELRELTGVEGDSVVNSDELAVWIYRDLQAERLAK